VLDEGADIHNEGMAKMGEHENVARVKSGYDAFSKGDLDALRELFTEDVVWHVPGDNQISGDYVGQDATFGYFGKLMELSDGTFKANLHEILASDGHAVGLHRDTAQRNGKSLDTDEALIFHMRNGKVYEAWEAYPDHGAFDAFWS
jgi:ketosteroid isomerase-like protein